MSAAARIRREGPSVHHALCDLRRPPAGPLTCTCRVQDVAAKLADLLDAIDRPLHDREKYEDWMGSVQGKALALEAVIDRSGT